MISHSQFGKLRLSQFRPRSEIVSLANWEYMDAVWIGEAVGFSEWLRLENDPNVLRSLTIDFSEFPDDATNAVLSAIDLPVRAGMSLEQLRSVLGEPVESLRLDDRVSYDFAVEKPHRYCIGCTILASGGLTYLGVMSVMTHNCH
jgi:hypothetical protein